MSRFSIKSPILGRVFILIVVLALFAPSASALFFDPVPSYCVCFSNSTIIPLYRPNDPGKPCLSCTRQFCLDQKLAICKGAKVPELDTDVGTGTEGDVEARCFKRDSPRNQLIVTFFILVIIGLLLFAGIQQRLSKAIEERGARPTDLREWSQALFPARFSFLGRSITTQTQGLGFGDMRNAGTGMGTGGVRGYAPVSVGS